MFITNFILIGINMIFLLVGLFSLISAVQLIFTFATLPRRDELEKLAVYQSLSISMIIMMLINLIQTIVYSTIGKGIEPIIEISSIPGNLISDDPLHFDSFLFSCFVIGVAYLILRRKYGLLSKKEAGIKVGLPLLILLSLVLFPLFANIISNIF